MVTVERSFHRPIDRFLRPFGHLLHSQMSAGLVLFAAAAAALIWANSPAAHSYHELWHTHLVFSFGSFSVDRTLHHWISEGLMAAFFFLVGMEIKREILGGQLSTLQDALLPILAALGGLTVPALIYLAINTPGTPAGQGWGVPMATDIAFALGLLSLLGRRVPLALKIFLTAVAIVDDIGAVLVIALFYTNEISLPSLAFAGGALGVMALANLLGVRSAWFYALLGIGCVWTGFLLSGVHATIAGFLAALTIPANPTIDESGLVATLRGLTERFEAIPPNSTPLLRAEQRSLLQSIREHADHADTPLQELESALHPLVAFVILPVFALANAGISLGPGLVGQLRSPVALGIALGLVVGKAVGIFGATWLGVKTGLAKLPEGLTWMQVLGASILGGVGFTMSLFVTYLAFLEPAMIDQAKAGILIASCLAGVTGCAVLWIFSAPDKSSA